jgi:glutathione synthase/RimK-type ligase-like ATP-grasp enzyme
MIKPRKFDVLIVYNGTATRSASLRDKANTTPFPLTSKSSSCNIAYAYFLESCAKQKIKAAFSTSNDVIGSGLCSSYWSYEDGAWHKSRKMAYSTTIFDKFSPRSKVGKVKHKLLFSSKKIKPFNDPTLRKLFSDKQKTYNSLSDHAIPTVTLKGNTLDSINSACDMLTSKMRQNTRREDFSGDIIMKDRFGAGGYHVYKFQKNESPEMLIVKDSNPDISFVIQPFANTDCPTDIRLIYMGGKIIESYIRVAAQNDFRCNEHQGGSLTYLDINNIPSNVTDQANAIIAKLGNYHSLYSLDFIVSNSGKAYLLEGNIGPGLDWNLSVKKEEVNAKKFIRTIVKQLASKVNT